MPRATRKSRLQNPHKCQLLFVDQPRNGSRHDYGPRLRSAINPRSFVSERSRQSVPVRSWVSPQFTSLEDTADRRVRQRKKKNHQLPTSTLNRTSLSTQLRSTACKYPTLLFTTSNSVPLRSQRALGQNSTVSHVGDSPETRRPRCQRDGNIAPVSRDDAPRPTFLNTVACNASTSGAEVTPKHTHFTAGKRTSSFTPHASTAETNSVLTPPHIQTPEMPRCGDTASSSFLSLLFSPNQPKTPPRTNTILVKDTPESDYGLKVTWRRRKKIKRLLTQRGQLLDTEAMISNRWSEVV
ncbi:RAD9, HUS1, RAD1-interacting nuclear orphan protein 1 [Tachysurus fulvidraco]|uniref:RAD9, HUS1, RAD1-interacting nuclear orphan protein 1 n=1 Tax=Tachysurus fulvidraco TaxID=1234273 RepID=UPI000F4DC199|nr:RAD9, HUS1, RAD1-interacting nuclear orphan protein 1 [Tachysurus fulvidraco]